MISETNNSITMFGKYQGMFNVKSRRVVVRFYALCVFVLVASTVFAQQKSKKPRTSGGTISFKKEVFPIIKKNCLPCHAEDNFNPSELSMDSHSLLVAGGKHGSPVVAGKSKESIIIQKLGPKPPSGDPMPLDTKKKKGEPSKKKLSDEEIKLITDWIDQGAKDN